MKELSMKTLSIARDFRDNVNLYIKSNYSTKIPDKKYKMEGNKEALQTLLNDSNKLIDMMNPNTDWEAISIIVEARATATYNIRLYEIKLNELYEAQK